MLLLRYPILLHSQKTVSRWWLHGKKPATNDPSKISQWPTGHHDRGGRHHHGSYNSHHGHHGGHDGYDRHDGYDGSNDSGGLRGMLAHLATPKTETLGMCHTSSLCFRWRLLGIISSKRAICQTWLKWLNVDMNSWWCSWKVIVFLSAGAALLSHL